MAGSGPQKYPGADTSHWWQTKWGGDLMEVNVAVLHTTEGIGLTDYNGGSMAPNLTAIADFKNKRLRWYQHFDIDRSSRALRNLRGGVETNTLNVVQVEFEGTCDYSKRERWGDRVAGRDYIYWGDPPDWALRDAAHFLRWLHAEHNVPLTGPSMWLTYGPDPRRPGITPASYGASPARMSFAAWNSFKGICGHQHVPENDHGDPGALPFTKLIALAKEPVDDRPTPEPAPQPSTKPKVSLAHVVYAAKHDPASTQGHTSYKSEVLLVEKALHAEGLLDAQGVDGSFGTKTISAYAALQRRYGYSGSAADVIPGKTCLTRLCDRHGFQVTA